jgi:hypothetical protein
MAIQQTIQSFKERQVRTAWNSDQEKWYFSVVDVCSVLTDSKNPTDYLKKLRKREPELNTYIGTNCPQVPMTTESGKLRLTHIANIYEQGELVYGATVRNFRTVQKEGSRTVTRTLTYYIKKTK